VSERRVSRKDLEGIPRISPAEAREMVEAGRAVLVDTRDPRYYTDAHALGSISVPFAEVRRPISWRAAR